MPTNAIDTAAKEAEKAKATLKTAANQAEKSFAEVAESAKASITEAASRAEAAIRDGLDSLRKHSRDYAGQAGDQLDHAQRYVVERVKEKPLTATVAGVGVGILIGLLLANRGGDRR